MEKKKIIVAISGGIDSAVAAYLLKKEGHDVSGITMNISVEGGSGNNRITCTPADIRDSEEVCRSLEIPHYIVDFSGTMEECVVRPFIDEYLCGRTPNPCVRCNRNLKFGALLNKIREMGFDYLATGHYADISFENEGWNLEKPADPMKDQTYFLYSVPRERFNNVLFPLSKYTKENVRKIADDIRLPVVDKRESQDVCFFSSGGSIEFFKNRGISAKEGDIVHINGELMGRHKGIIHYTIGQRRGLGIGHTEALYVLSIDVENNRLLVGEMRYLKSRQLIADALNFDQKEREGRALAKIRYAHEPAPCKFKVMGSILDVVFDEPQNAITPGQSVVIYEKNRVIGGGIIKRVLDLNTA